jgi:hypothetical protein
MPTCWVQRKQPSVRAAPSAMGKMRREPGWAARVRRSAGEEWRLTQGDFAAPAPAGSMGMWPESVAVVAAAAGREPSSEFREWGREKKECSSPEQAWALEPPVRSVRKRVPMRRRERLPQENPDLCAFAVVGGGEGPTCSQCTGNGGVVLEARTCGRGADEGYERRRMFRAAR